MLRNKITHMCKGGLFLVLEISCPNSRQRKREEWYILMTVRERERGKRRPMSHSTSPQKHQHENPLPKLVNEANNSPQEVRQGIGKQQRETRVRTAASIAQLDP